VDVVTGCYMLVRRDAIDAVGLMDERFFMYFDETDWCHRFHGGGWKRRFTPDAEIIHIGGGSAPRLGRRRAQVTNTSFVTYMFKHWSRPRAVAGVYLIALFYVTRLPMIVLTRALTRGDRYDAMVANHWAGLKDILRYTRHVPLQASPAA
jgi:GT2 family glycosyltransferase